VVERGSLLSHSAVVARELGVPTVVAVAGVMDALQTGDWVRVDATSGTITLLESSS
jgi:phosphohistidine swiveling domain-containing protein